MKKMCPSGYHYSGFVATHALRHMMYHYTLRAPINQRVLNKPSKKHSLVPAIHNRRSCAQVHELPQSHYGDSLDCTLFS